MPNPPTPVRFSLKPLSKDDARTISGWRYGEPYSIYDGNPAAIPALVNPRHRYYAALAESGELAGYFCFGADARIPAGERRGLYGGENVLDVGLGLSPDLTGRGVGAEFVCAGLRFAMGTFRPQAFRLTVASFNRRAIRAYEKAGFETVAAFTTPALDGEREWLVMSRGLL